jgi:hypothetical protein
MATIKRVRTTPGGTKAKTTTTRGNGKNSHSNGAVEDAIRLRAYELYMERGFRDGYAQEDWLKAEAEVATHQQTM